MIHYADITREALKAIPLRDRLIVKMISEMTEYYFADEAIDIIVDRNPHEKVKEMDEKTIREMQSIKEAAHNAYWALREIYESEFGNLSGDTDIIITQAANNFAKDALKARHWK